MSILLSNFEVRICALHPFSRTGIWLQLVLVPQIEYKNKISFCFLILLADAIPGYLNVFVNILWLAGSVLITPEEFENTALFTRLGLSSTLIRHENEAFQKRSKLSAPSSFSCGRKTCWKLDFSIIIWFHRSSFSQTQLQFDQWLLFF